MRKSFSVFIFVGTLMGIFPTIYSGMNAQPQIDPKEQKALQYEVSVSLKLVQVYVTDKKGKPVTDLEKSDFELYDNGELKKITDFEMHVLYAPPAKSVRQQEKPAPPPAKEVNRKIFFFFDFAFNSALGIKNSKKAALHFIDSQLQPADEVGVVSYSKFKGLVLQADLTTDHEKVRKVVEGFGIKDSLGRAEDIEPDDEGIQPPIDEERYKHEVLDFINNMSNLAKALGYIEGGKHIILFSTGVISRILSGSSPMPIGEYTAFFPVNPMDPGDYLLQMTYEKMMRELTSSNTIVYAIYSEGLAAFARRHLDRPEIDSVLDHLGIEPLQRIAKNTGGKYLRYCQMSCTG